MGIPAFFRWLCMRNPSLLLDATDNETESEESLNPEIDNLYLDMNGIIHPCCHPQNTGVPLPKDFKDMCYNIFIYIDKIMNIIRP
jgi:5'-3' exoribonuclease 2